MEQYKSLRSRIINLDDKDFPEVALRIFQYQAKGNSIYSEFLGHLGVEPAQVKHWRDIPFLPIELFKAQKVTTGQWPTDVVFNSSGTGGAPSKHYIRDLEFYHQISAGTFNRFYGSLSQYHLFALLPGYQENQSSSLISMVQHFIESTDTSYSGFYLDDHRQLMEQMHRAHEEGTRKVLLWGVSFALMDLAESYSLNIPGLVVMETGGMKGRRPEITRDQLHHTLQKAFAVEAVHSEYGMAELSSQAYAVERGLFHLPPWMRVVVRELDDPLYDAPYGRTGRINIIDLANLHSCAFIATQDIGIMKPEGSFLILGRMDNSEVRGCNLMLEA